MIDECEPISWSDCVFIELELDVVVMIPGASTRHAVPGADPRIYEEVSDMSQLQPTIEEYLNDYNAESKQPMPLVTVWTSTRESRRGPSERQLEPNVSLIPSTEREQKLAHYDRERPRVEAQLELCSTQARHVHGRDLARRAHHARAAPAQGQHAAPGRRRERPPVAQSIEHVHGRVQDLQY